ncbi:hypothetical protein PI124_g21615 [Phytophthora idaei]|nr:hypothetical protein PI125_g23263 [Phytophthora idaei]KAG3128346.1 hypothetical protein PI126_g21440 [Phytophthora idaei]KAG3233308.1 hypothetical protein PI124_g21615 [Phytophthora idaei]
MRLAFVALVLVIVLQATCGAASHVSVNQFQSPKAAVSKNNVVRLLRARGTDPVEEERAINFKNLLDVKKWFGVKRPVMNANNVADDFTKQSIANMLANEGHQRKIFDRYTLKQIETNIGPETIGKFSRVRDMLQKHPNPRS